jgi:hypothetical protein
MGSLLAIRSFRVVAFDAVSWAQAVIQVHFIHSLPFIFSLPFSLLLLGQYLACKLHSAFVAKNSYLLKSDCQWPM